MNISVDHENNKKSEKKGLLTSFIVLVLLGITIGIFISLSEGFTAINGILTGGILFICGLVPFLFLFNVRRKREEM